MQGQQGNCLRPTSLKVIGSFIDNIENTNSQNFNQEQGRAIKYWKRIYNLSEENVEHIIIYLLPPYQNVSRF
jgi:hypothetical protein